MVKYIILDVDGTLTDGGIYYDEYGNELKKFCTKDAAGIIAAKAVGLKIFVLTGRECFATTRRLKELNVDSLYQNVKDKAEWLSKWKAERNITKDSIGYIGDDLNDLSAMKLCGFIGCPADACEEIRCAATYVSHISGGNGAVRDIIEWYLKKNKLWDKAIYIIYGI